MFSSKWKSCLTAIVITGISFTVSKSALAVSLYSVTDLGILTGDTNTNASDINDLGQVIINSFNPENAFFYSNGLLNKISPLPGDNQLSVRSINNLGQVVGSSLFFNGSNNFTYNPFVYSNGITQSIPIENAIPYEINDSGQIVGGAAFLGPFLYSNGMTNIIGVPGSVAYGLNNSGQVVGILNIDTLALDILPLRGAFLYENGQIIKLGAFPGDQYSVAQSINDLGQIVGGSGPTEAFNTSAFLYNRGEGFKNLGKLRLTDRFSAGLGINNLGQVVGFSGINNGFDATNENNARAFLYENDTLYDLNELVAPGSSASLTLLAASAINNRGQIVGRGAVNGELHAFLLTPVSSTSVPESNLSFPILIFSVFMGLFTSLKRKSILN